MAEDDAQPGGIHPHRAVEMANDAIRGTLMERMVNHLRALAEGHVTCTGVPVRIGRRVADDGSDPVAVATLTVSIRDP